MKKSMNNKGHIVTLRFSAMYVVCDEYKDAISENGAHYGYMYDGKIYCNVYPEGRIASQWIKSFDTRYHDAPAVYIDGLLLRREEYGRYGFE